MKNRNKRNIIILILAIMLLFVGTGYALLTVNLKITSISSVGKLMDVKLTNVSLKEKSDSLISTSYEITNNGMGIVFNTSFIKPGDYVVYNIYIQNNTSNGIEVSEISKNLIEGSNTFDIEWDLEDYAYIASNSSIEFNVTLKYLSVGISLDDNATMGLSITVSQTDSSSGGSSNDELSHDVNYSGYYADTNNDGNPDGIIFVDLMDSSYSSGNNWNDDDGKFTYTTISESKAYSITNDNISNVNFPLDTKQMISAKSSTGTKRFYVIALNDLGIYYWDYDYIYDASSVTNEGCSTCQMEIGTGYRNTGLLLNSSLKDYNSNIWANLDSYYNDGWFVPSRAEISAFGNFLETRYSSFRYNVSSYGFRSERYWTSSCKSDQCFVGDFSSWYIVWSDRNTMHPVRLITMM